MTLQINSLEDVRNLSKGTFKDNDIEKVVILGIDATSSYAGKLKLSTSLDNHILRKATMNRDLLVVAKYVCQYEMCFAFGLQIDDNFRASLSENDKIILWSVYKLKRIAEELIKEV